MFMAFSAKDTLKDLIAKLFQPRQSYEVDRTAWVATTGISISQSMKEKIPVAEFDPEQIQKLASDLKSSKTPAQANKVLNNIPRSSQTITVSRSEIVDAIFKLVKNNPELASDAKETVTCATEAPLKEIEAIYNRMNSLAGNQHDFTEIKQDIQGIGADTLTRFIQDAAKGKQWEEADIKQCFETKGACPLLMTEEKVEPTIIDVAAEQAPVSQAVATAESPEEVKPISNAAPNYLSSVCSGACFGALNTVKRGLVDSASRWARFSNLSRHGFQLVTSSMLSYAVTNDISFSIASACFNELVSSLGSSANYAALGTNFLYSAYASGSDGALAFMASYAGSIAGSAAAQKGLELVGLTQLDQAQAVSMYRNR